MKKRQKRIKANDYLGSGLIESPNEVHNIVSIVDANDMRNHLLTIRDYFSCISYDRATATCRWCLKEHNTKWDLKYGNQYTKWAYDSEDCKAMYLKAKGISQLDEGVNDIDDNSTDDTSSS